jgi:hypothetical protein
MIWSDPDAKIGDPVWRIWMDPPLQGNDLLQMLREVVNESLSSDMGKPLPEAHLQYIACGKQDFENLEDAFVATSKFVTSEGHWNSLMFKGIKVFQHPVKDGTWIFVRYKGE